MGDASKAGKGASWSDAVGDKGELRALGMPAMDKRGFIRVFSLGVGTSLVLFSESNFFFDLKSGALLKEIKNRLSGVNECKVGIHLPPGQNETFQTKNIVETTNRTKFKANLTLSTFAIAFVAREKVIVLSHASLEFVFRVLPVLDGCSLQTAHTCTKTRMSVHSG